MLHLYRESWPRAPGSDDVDGRGKSGAEDHIAAAMIAAMTMTMTAVLLPSNVRKKEQGSRQEELCEPSFFFKCGTRLETNCTTTLGKWKTVSVGRRGSAAKSKKEKSRHDVTGKFPLPTISCDPAAYHVSRPTKKQSSKTKIPDTTTTSRRRRRRRERESGYTSKDYFQSVLEDDGLSAGRQASTLGACPCFHA